MIKTEKLSMLFTTEDVQTKALNEVSLEIKKGEFVAIMGPSGCGKSTLLNILGTLDSSTSGKYYFEGKEIDKMSESQLTSFRKGNIGFVFQNFNLIDELTVFENVELPLVYLNGKKADRKKKVMEVLDRMNIAHRAGHFPQQLSGGQQQRVAIARALMMEPQVLLFDEPTAALDPEITAQIVSIIRELAETNITQVIVTHEVEVARKTASRVVYMENGHIVEQGDASCFTEPQTEAFKNYLSH